MLDMGLSNGELLQKINVVLQDHDNSLLAAVPVLCEAELP